MFSKLGFALLTTAMLTLVLACNNASKNQQKSGETSDSTSVSEVLDKMDKDKSWVPKEKLTYTVSLGVMPDMNYEGEGVLIGHVNEGKTGYLAGIQKGDVVVEMGDQKITDLVSYTKALGAFEKGDQTKVVVKRDDQLLTMLVEF